MRGLAIVGLLMTALGSTAIGQGSDTATHDLDEVTEKPSMVSHPDLGYKECYQDAGLTGTDLVKFVIDTGGHVEPGSVTVAVASDPILDTLAVRVVRGTVFRPGGLGGVHVRVSAGLPVRFGTGAPPTAPEDRVFAETCVDEKAQASGVTDQPNVPKMMASPGTVAARTVTIRVRALVGADGRVVDASIEDAGLSADVAQFATSVATKEKFRPARINGIAVATWVTIPVHLAQVVQVIHN